MEPTNPIDAHIRAFLKTHVANHSELSVAVGHSTSWLHKYVNGQGHATVDDLVRIAGLVMGLNLPTLSETEQKLLKACQSLAAPDLQDVVAYAEHRGRLARRAPSKESSAPTTHILPGTKRIARGKR